MNHVMVDIETLDNKCGAVILSIGAVVLDETGLKQKFYSGPISRISNLKYGFTAGVSTLDWWDIQDEDAKTILKQSLESNLTIQTALSQFYEFFPTDAYLWGNGADFDNAILSYAYAKTGLVQPWKYSHSRCYRTAKALSKVPKPVHSGIQHHALGDAVNQALHLVEILKDLHV